MFAGNPLIRRIRAQFRRWRATRYAYTRLVEVRIHRSCLLHNLRQFQAACAPRRIAPVLKSNAYGHGLVHVARVLDQSGIAFLVVDGYFEALILRNEGIRSPIAASRRASEGSARSAGGDSWLLKYGLRGPMLTSG